jgi:hypothetical protein
MKSVAESRQNGRAGFLDIRLDVQKPERLLPVFEPGVMAPSGNLSGYPGRKTCRFGVRLGQTGTSMLEWSRNFVSIRYRENWISRNLREEARIWGLTMAIPREPENFAMTQFAGFLP